VNTEHQAGHGFLLMEEFGIVTAGDGALYLEESHSPR
jgi:hypothetical protein